MESPPEAIPFISFKNDQFIITDEAKEFLSSLDNRQLGVISIVGKYRTGKSYFVNKVLLQAESNKGFAVGPTINPCTKGLWLWKKTITIKNDNNEEEFDVLIIDTEGFGGIDENTNHDTRIFLFSLLLSSYFIFNSMGNIDEDALNSLMVIINLANNVKIKNNGDATVNEIADTFPSFLWVIRDFMLKVEDDSGMKISAKKYLENSLSNVKGNNKSAMEKNKVRRMLKHFFQRRDCMTFIRPVEKEKDLQRLESLDESMLRPQFLNELQVSREKICKNVKPKIINNNVVNGSMLLKATEAYVAAVNKGSVPNVENAWTYVVEQETEKALKLSLRYIDDFIKQNKKDNPTIFEEETWKTDLLMEARKLFKKKAVSRGDNIEITIKKLETVFDEKIKKFEDTKNYELKKELGKLFNQKIIIINGKTHNGEYKDISMLKEDLERLREELMEGAVNQIKVNMINELMTPIENKLMNEMFEQRKKEEEKVLEQHKNTVSQLEQAKNNINSIQQEKESLNDKYDELKLTVKELGREKQNLMEKNESLVQEINEKQMELVNMQSEMKRMEINYENEREKLISKFEIERQSNDLEVERDKKGRETDILMKDNEIKLLKEELMRQKNIEKSLMKEIGGYKVDIEKFREKLNTISIETPESKQRMNQLEDDLKKHRNEITQLKMEKITLTDQIHFHKNNFEHIKETYDKFISNISNTNRTSTENVNSELITTNKTLSNSIARLEGKNRQLEEQVSYLKTQKKILKNTKSVQCNKCNNNFHYTKLMQHLEHCDSEMPPKKTYQSNYQDNSMGNVYEKYRPREENRKRYENPQKNISIKIGQTEIIKLSDRQPFIVYNVKVSLGDKSWQIKRKFKAFVNLHQDIINNIPGVVIPNSSSVFTHNRFMLNQRKSNSSLKEKKSGLEAFVNDIVKITEIRFSDILRQFLDLKEDIPEYYLKQNKREESNVKDFINDMPSDNKSMSDDSLSRDHNKASLDRNPDIENSFSQSSHLDAPVNERNSKLDGNKPFNKTEKELYFKQSYRQNLFN